MDVYDPFADPASDEADKTSGQAEGKRKRTPRWDKEAAELPEPAPAASTANNGRAKRGRWDVETGDLPKPVSGVSGAGPSNETAIAGGRQSAAALAAAYEGSLETTSFAADAGVDREAGVVQPFLKRRVLCSHFANGDCRWGNACNFSHDTDQLRAGAPQTTELDVSRLDCDAVTKSFKIPRRMGELMTDHTAQLLVKAAGAEGVTWQPSEEQNRVTIVGGQRQVDRAGQLLKRLCKHCSWGISPARIAGILNPTACTSVRIRFSPMTTSLRQAVVGLNSRKPQLTIGSGSTSDMVLQGKLLSRAHAEVEFFPDKGAVYVVDVSTNGTFLNGERLPPKGSGKVFVSHGDELVFPNRVDGKTKGDDITENFGYIVNLEFL